MESPLPSNLSLWLCMSAPDQEENVLRGHPKEIHNNKYTVLIHRFRYCPRLPLIDSTCFGVTRYRHTVELG